MLFNSLFYPIYRQRPESVEDGFSLIELLTVVVIIGILAALTIPSYQYFVGKAKVTVAQSTLVTVREILINHSSENKGSYPATIDFTTGLDDQGLIVFQQPLLDQIHKDLSPPIIYTGNTTNFTLTAQATNDDHTVLILTDNSLNIQGQ